MSELLFAWAETTLSAGWDSRGTAWSLLLMALPGLSLFAEFCSSFSQRPLKLMVECVSV